MTINNTTLFGLGNYRGIYTNKNDILNMLDDDVKLNDWQLEVSDSFYNLWVYKPDVTSEMRWTQLIPNISITISNTNDIEEEVGQQVDGQIVVYPPDYTIYIYYNNQWNKINQKNSEFQEIAGVAYKSLQIGDMSSIQLSESLDNQRNRIVPVILGENMSKGTVLGLKENDNKVYPFMAGQGLVKSFQQGTLTEIESHIINGELVIGIESESALDDKNLLLETSYHNLKSQYLYNNIIQYVYLVKEDDKYKTKYSIYSIESTQLVLKYTGIILDGYSGTYDIIGLSRDEANVLRFAVAYRDDSDYAGYIKLIKITLTNGDILNDSVETYAKIPLDEYINEVSLAHQKEAQSFIVQYNDGNTNHGEFQLYFDNGERKISSKTFVEAPSSNLKTFYYNRRYYIQYTQNNENKVKVFNEDGADLDQQQIISHSEIENINFQEYDGNIVILFQDKTFNHGVYKIFTPDLRFENINKIFTNNNIIDLSVTFNEDKIQVTYISEIYDADLDEYIYKGEYQIFSKTELDKNYYYIGILNEDGIKDSVKEQVVLNGIYNTTGLIPGSKYYINDNSLLTTNKTEYFQGVQLNDHELFVTNYEFHGRISDLIQQSDINQEPNLGLPKRDGQILTSDTNGKRNWTDYPKLDESNLVHKTKDETINGRKTFNDIPILPNFIPSLQTHQTSKKYVDDQINAMDNDLVHNSLDEVITGEKTFNQFPKIQSPTIMVPTENDQFIHKYFYEKDLFNKLSNYVNITNNQEIDGIKEFRQFPLLPFGVPSEINQQTNKSYVDNKFNMLDANTVKTSTDQLINGTKTFNEFPKLPLSNPLNKENQTNKLYVDNEIQKVTLNLNNKSDINHTHTGEDIAYIPIVDRNGNPMTLNRDLTSSIENLNNLIRYLQVNENEIYLRNRTNFHNNNTMETLTDMINSLNQQFTQIDYELKNKTNTQDTYKNKQELQDSIQDIETKLLDKINENYQELLDKTSNISEVQNNQVPMDKFNLLNDSVNIYKTKTDSLNFALEDFINNEFEQEKSDIRRELNIAISDLDRDLNDKLQNNSETLNNSIKNLQERITDMTPLLEFNNLSKSVNEISQEVNSIKGGQRRFEETTNNNLSIINENIANLEGKVDQNYQILDENKASKIELDNLENQLVNYKEYTESNINELIANKLDREVYQNFRTDIYNTFQSNINATVTSMQTQLAQLEGKVQAGSAPASLIQDVEGKVSYEDLPDEVRNILLSGTLSNITIQGTFTANKGNFDTIDAKSIRSNGIEIQSNGLVYNAVANDYQEAFELVDELKYQVTEQDAGKPVCIRENRKVDFIRTEDDLLNIVGIISNQYGFLLYANQNELFKTKVPIQMVGSLDIPKNLFNPDLKIKLGYHIIYDISTNSYITQHPTQIPYYLDLGKVIQIYDNYITILVK